MSLITSRFAALSFAVLLGSITLPAQSPAPSAAKSDPAQPATGIYVIPVPTSQNCPVSMHAQHKGMDAERIQTGQKSPALPSGPMQRIHLILGNRETPANVAAATVTVRGTDGKWRTVPTGNPGNGPSEIAKTLHLNFNTGKDQGTWADLVLPGFTSVTSISLDSLTFADGSTWIPANHLTCRTTPDLLMLVSSK
jgi:hypothetical protein